MTKWPAAAAILLLFGPYFVLRSPVVPQVPFRAIAVSFWAFGMLVAIFWFGLKSQMIRPGGKLYQPQYESMRPKIEWSIRLVVIAFGAFYFFVLSLPFAKDLTQVAISQRVSRITDAVKYTNRSGSRGISDDVGLTGSDKSYHLFYQSKSLRVGKTYEFVVLPRSRIILDYDESKK